MTMWVNSTAVTPVRGMGFGDEGDVFMKNLE